MTRRLIVMRHAKSSWKIPGQPDHDRPLNRRGKRAAAALGDWLRTHGHLPDQVLSSDSRRTRETWAGLALDGSPVFTRDLYLASSDEIAQVLRRATGPCVLVLGHNPGIGDFADDVLGAPPDHPRFADYPTGATLVAELPIDDWRNLTTGQGRVLDFTIPPRGATG